MPRRWRLESLRLLTFLLSLAAGSTLLAQGPPPPPPPLPPVPAPPENPITQAKAVLGKILFWDEQLSSDDTVACGTCHRPAAGGGDPRISPSSSPTHPGFDGLFGTADDVNGSPGVVRSTATGAYVPEPHFGLNVQVTRRATPSFLMSAFEPRLFWDGRAQGPYLDPVTGQVSIPAGGALENQAAGPPLSSAEMAHDGRSWSQIASKLPNVAPLKLAWNLTPDITAALFAHPTYADLFAWSFGDPAITPDRIIKAIATYERTLVPNQTPFDAFLQGNPAALTMPQQMGLQIFRGAARCDICHIPPFFFDNLFHDIGVRPDIEDTGRQEVTNNPMDRAKFKTPTLRNVGLRNRFMHNGRMTTLEQVVNFYNLGGDFPADPLVQPLGLGTMQRAMLVDFVRNALTDPRVAQELPPFDRPRLHSERALANPQVYGSGTSGSGSFAPRWILPAAPPSLGASSFKLGLKDGLGGTAAWLAFSTAPSTPAVVIGSLPIAIDPAQLVAFVPMTLAGAGPGAGHATFQLPLPNDPLLAGIDIYGQWLVLDPGAPAGATVSAALRATLF